MGKTKKTANHDADDATKAKILKREPTTSVERKDKMVPSRNDRREIVFEDYSEFKPNLSPKEILQAGSFGGGYFRPIQSAVTNEKLSNCWKEFPNGWFEGLKISMSIANPTYDKSMNKYKVKCGASLDEWESKGWIKAQDPYGWFQWYCRFYLGRRTDDDERQIGRWHRFLARFKINLVNKIKKAETTYDNYSISPVIRQSLLHWGYELVPQDLSQKRKVGKLENLEKVPTI